MNTDRSERTRCAEASERATLQLLLVDGWGFSRRAYIDTATQWSSSFSCGITFAAAMVPMPLTPIASIPTSLAGATCRYGSIAIRSESLTTNGGTFFDPRKLRRRTRSGPPSFPRTGRDGPRIALFVTVAPQLPLYWRGLSGCAANVVSRARASNKGGVGSPCKLYEYALGSGVGDTLDPPACRTCRANRTLSSRDAAASPNTNPHQKPWAPQPRP